MMELRKFVVPEIVFGSGARGLCDRYAVNFGSSRPLIVTDPGVIATGLVDETVNALSASGLTPAVYSTVSSNPRDSQVVEGCAYYKDRGCDVIIAIGGGSPMDCAKAIGMLAANGGNIADCEGIDNVAIPGPPLICIPTTAGTAADISQFAIISDTARRLKFAIISKTAVPDVALVDPETTYTMDPYLTACTGVDALVHAIEACVSTASSPLTDLHALEAVRMIAGNLAAAVRDGKDAAARGAMMYASMEAGMAFSNASLGVVHAMAHSLGGLLDLPHGECNAILLNAAIERNYAFARDKFASIGASLGLERGAFEGNDGGAALGDWVTRLLETVSIRPGLASRGVTRDTVPALARNANADPCAVTNPSPLDEGIIGKLYERAL